MTQRPCVICEIVILTAKGAERSLRLAMAHRRRLQALRAPAGCLRWKKTTMPTRNNPEQFLRRPLRLVLSVF